jgi:hypothetical protein
MTIPAALRMKEDKNVTSVEQWLEAARDMAARSDPEAGGDRDFSEQARRSHFPRARNGASGE